MSVRERRNRKDKRRHPGRYQMAAKLVRSLKAEGEKPAPNVDPGIPFLPRLGT